jgi:hypothetical protein
MLLRPFGLTFFFVILIIAKSFAQDTLPRINVKNISNRIVISWKVTYGAKINTINIQRSADSLRNFTTIGSVLDPMNRENGFVDNKAPNPNMFYRVFVAFEGGSYIFTQSYRPVKDTAVALPPGMQMTELPKVIPPPPAGFVPSKFIYTGKENNIIIELHDAGSSKYSIKFFDEKNYLVFEIHKVTEPYLIIEKVNFLHAGWFYFMLYDNGILKEKNQFYIPKEGKVGIPPGEVNKKF